LEGDALVVKDVTPEIFKKIERDRDAAHRGFRFHYSPQVKTLIITVPNQTHERLHSQIPEFMRTTIVAMGLGSNFKWSHGKTSYATNGSSGEGDSDGYPYPIRGGGNDWPSIVIEAGFSQSLNSLRSRMRWWFDASSHQVKIVLLSKIYPNASPQHIILEQWVETVPTGRPATRAATQAAARGASLEPNRLQEIRIRRTRASPPAGDVYLVDGGPLRLDFERLFLRSPNIGEGDVVIGIPELQEFDEAVFRAHEM